MKKKTPPPPNEPPSCLSAYQDAIDRNYKKKEIIIWEILRSASERAQYCFCYVRREQFIDHILLHHHSKDYQNSLAKFKLWQHNC